MRKVELFPAYGQADVRSTTASNSAALDRFVAFSRVKYGCLLNYILLAIEQVILGYPEPVQHRHREQLKSLQLDVKDAAGKASCAVERIRRMNGACNALGYAPPAHAIALSYGEGELAAGASDAGT